MLIRAKWFFFPITIFALAFALRPMVTANFHEDGPKSSSEQIRHVLDSQVAAWNNGDLKEFMAGYWKSEKLTFFSGDKIEHGWQATYELSQKRYSGEGS